MIRLDQIRDSLEGQVPGLVATCSPDGVPNVCYLSQVEYVDAHHVALSFQFFNKTRRNILANPHATAAVVDPLSAVVHELSLQYLRTEVEGPLFERMKAKLASIATATGTTGIFRLQGADIYRVLDIERLPGLELPKPSRPSRLTALRACSEALTGCDSLSMLLDRLLEGIAQHFGVDHAMVLAVDERAERFFTLASRGYESSGVGSEIPLGAGVVGIAALRRTPIRLAHVAAEYGYVQAIREQAAGDPALCDLLEREIPFPGLRQPRSQLAVPIEDGQGRVLGVLHLESDQDLRFDYEDEDALLVLARQVGLAMRELAGRIDDRPVPLPDSERAGDPCAGPGGGATAADGPALVVRHFARDDSIFLDDTYLIKGVAGAIFWSLIRAWSREGRVAFSNRELRADPGLGLPELADNLEARLHLLDRRLRERDCGILMHRTGRGRFNLAVRRRVRLSDS